MIFRNDDISRFTKLDELKRVNEVFLKYSVGHTIAVIARQLHEHKELIDYLKTAGNFDVQVHCFDHFDFTVLTETELRYQFEECLLEFDACEFSKPSVWYCPWNRCNALCMQVASEFGLTASYEKVSLEYFIKHKGKVMYEVVNFHSWFEPEQGMIEPALKIYTGK